MSTYLLLSRTVQTNFINIVDCFCISGWGGELPGQDTFLNGVCVRVGGGGCKNEKEIRIEKK